MCSKESGSLFHFHAIRTVPALSLHQQQHNHTSISNPSTAKGKTDTGPRRIAATPPGRGITTTRIRRGQSQEDFQPLKSRVWSFVPSPAEILCNSHWRTTQKHIYRQNAVCRGRSTVPRHSASQGRPLFFDESSSWPCCISLSFPLLSGGASDRCLVARAIASKRNASHETASENVCFPGPV